MIHYGGYYQPVIGSYQQLPMEGEILKALQATQ
jgi:hypothetical protein